MQTSVVRIRDVADAAGVSVGTVSKVLNGRGAEYQINAETMLHVQRAAAQLGYVPNSLARSLRARCTGQIGVVLDDLHQAHTSQPTLDVTLALDGALLVGLKMAARERHIPAVVLYPYTDADVLADPARYLDGRIDGLLVRLHWSTEDALFNRLDPLRLPLVAIWRQDVPANVGYADVDHRGGAFLAVQHLVGLGHTRVAYFGPSLEGSSAHFALRYSGYRDALRTAGIFPRPEWCVRDAAALLALLRAPDPLTAVFAVTDLRAAELATDLVAAGVRIPADLSLVGFDDIAAAGLIAGGLTTVHHPIQEMAIQAVHHLLDLINGAPVEECRSIVPTHLVVRASTAPVQRS